MLRLVKYFYFLLAIFICFEIIRISIPYYTPDFGKGFLIGKEEIWSFYKFALYAHIIFAPLAFLLTIPQILYPKWSAHRSIGKAYVIVVLLLAAPSGLIMAFFAHGGWMGKVLFLSLSILWIFYTYLAFSNAKKNQFDLHRKFAIGSFILCNSAILLRLFHYLNLKLDLLNSGNTYVIISFLSWVPILIMYEIYYLNRK